MIEQLVLTEQEKLETRKLLIRIAQDDNNLTESGFLEQSAIFAHELPVRVRRSFYDFKHREIAPALLVTNNPVIPEDVGPTPARHWVPGEVRKLNVAQMLHGLYACLLGEPFGFETQQNGRIFNDLISLPGSRENSSSGMGKVGLHSEDAFQPFMPDYLGLMCLRNEQGATTTLSSLKWLTISPRLLHFLFETPFPSTRLPILFGDRGKPYLRYRWANCNDDREFDTALKMLSANLEENVCGITLKQGDGIYVDNLCAVHGRSPFNGQYGEHGRWFSRLVVLRDLRTTRSLRATSDSRVMLKARYDAANR